MHWYCGEGKPRRAVETIRVRTGAIQCEVGIVVLVSELQLGYEGTVGCDNGVAWEATATRGEKLGSRSRVITIVNEMNNVAPVSRIVDVSGWIFYFGLPTPRQQWPRLE